STRVRNRWSRWCGRSCFRCHEFASEGEAASAAQRTPPMTDEPGGASRTRMLTALALLWLAGTALRFTILAVPPVIPLIHDDLHLNATQIGVLTGLPSMLLAVAAVPGSLLIARLGVTAALVIGLLLSAAAGALRGLLPD